MLRVQISGHCCQILAAFLCTCNKKFLQTKIKFGLLNNAYQLPVLTIKYVFSVFWRKKMLESYTNCACQIYGYSFLFKNLKKWVFPHKLSFKKFSASFEQKNNFWSFELFFGRKFVLLATAIASHLPCYIVMDFLPVRGLISRQ
jgi:hypothetical protein